MARQAFVEKKFSWEVETVIRRANVILNEYAAAGFTLTLRQLFYQFVSRGHIPNTQKQYKRLGGIVGDARLAGMIDWDYMEDRTRNLASLQHFSGAQDALNKLHQWYHVDMWERQSYRPVVFIEKDALVGVIEGVCSENDVPYFSCRGYTSLSEIYVAAERFKAYLADGQTPYVIHFGDHDPSGLDMSRDIVDRLQKTFMADCEFKRVALNMDQIQEYEPPPNPAKTCLAIDTVLPTPNGWTTMEEVAVGDKLFGIDGGQYIVTAKSEVLYNKDCYEFTFAGGSTIISSDNHLWEVKSRGRSGGNLKTTKMIASCWREGKDLRPIYSVEVASAIQTEEVILPIPPYVLGAWLGDGNSDAEGFTCGVDDEETLDLIREEGFEVKRLKNYPTKATIYKLRGKLYNLGVANNKHIPMTYMRSSYTQRMHLLQGLMDTDGTVSENRGMTPCSYGSSRESLAHEVLELVISLGFRARLSESRAVLNGLDYGPTWRIEFYPGDANVFRLSRKRERLRGSKVSPRQMWRNIIRVRRIESVPVQCLSIDSPDHLYLAGIHFVPTHNTDSRYKVYLATYGDESWELDALDPPVFRSIVEREVASIVDKKQWDLDLKDKLAVKARLLEIGKDWESISSNKRDLAKILKELVAANNEIAVLQGQVETLKAKKKHKKSQ